MNNLYTDSGVIEVRKKYGLNISKLLELLDIDNNDFEIYSLAFKK